MTRVYGLLVFLFVIAYSVIAGNQYRNYADFSWGLFEFFLMGLFSTSAYYVFIFKTKKQFKLPYLLTALSYGLMSYMIIMYFIYKAVFRTDLTGRVFFSGHIFDAAEENYFPFISLFWLEGLTFLLGSTILILFLLGNQIKCRECTQSGFFSEKLLFKVAGSYQEDVKQLIKLSAAKDYSGLINYIQSRKISFPASQKTKRDSSYAFYLLTCSNCSTSYIVSKKYKDINDLEEDTASTYKVILKLDTNLHIRLTGK
ncbi:hypothetical protein [Evansella clarkii]|jgi:hypothetical protein|uniref:hypothetical protein n=1 Tax=Evansella clarkii TaxID=79879 RepID=UPI000997FC59|nr:hypothetical protein [Evansella clarkii]